MFSKSAQYYDDIYGAIDKDYATETHMLHGFIQKHKRTGENALLDVACGTGMHAELLSKYYRVEGLDLDGEMLKVARKKYPKIPFSQGDMVNFDLKRKFDVVTCLFSSIGYVKTKTKLRQAIKNMGKHLVPGGVLLIEPWFTPEQWAGRVTVLEVNKPDLKIVRMSRGSQRGRLSLIEFHYLIGTSKHIEHQTEIHELGLFTYEDHLNAFQIAGMKVVYNKKGLDGRGLYIGKKFVK